MQAIEIRKLESRNYIHQRKIKMKNVKEGTHTSIEILSAHARNPSFLKEFAEFKRSVICPICLHIIKDPSGLPCHHTFCTDCIVNALKYKECCPICSKKTLRRHINPLPSLNPIINSFSNLIDMLEQPDRTIMETVLPRCSIEKPSEFAVASVADMNINNLANDGAETKHLDTTVASAAVDALPPAVSILTPGTLVTVLPRTWIGINKPGGTGWVLGTHHSDGLESNGQQLQQQQLLFYDVKYVLDGTSDCYIPAVFVEKFTDLERTSRSSRKRNSLDTGMLPSTNEKKYGKYMNSASNTAKSHQPPPKSGSKSTASTSAASKGSINAYSSKNPRHREVENSGSGDENRPCPIGLSASSASAVTSVKKKVDNVGDTMSSGWSKSNNGDHKDTVRTMMVITTTSLPSPLSSVVLTFPDTFPQCKCVHRFDGSVTHLVVPADRLGVVKQRTMKYMQALINGSWIVSSKWITDSIAAGAILPEISYEVTGNAKATVEFAPRRSRLSHGDQKTPKLFAGICALLFGHFPTPGPPRSDIEELLISGGVDILCSTVEKFQHQMPRRHSMQPGGGDQTSSSSKLVNQAGNKAMTSTPHLFVVICSELAKLADLQQAFSMTSVATQADSRQHDANVASIAGFSKIDNNTGIGFDDTGGTSNALPFHCVRVTWVLDCITNFYLLRPEDYVAFPTSCTATI